MRMEEIFKSLSEEAREFQYGISIPQISIKEVTPFEFYRTYVSANQPVLIKNACNHWPAFLKWNKEYFCNTMGEKKVIVSVTPNGFADAVAYDSITQKEYFVLPEERSMTFSEFWRAMDHPEKYPGVYYLQRQNSNLTEELPELLQDMERHLPWATEVFGSAPDAVNFWAGDQRAVTSMHKDPYENIYCVVRGHKDFILHPPTDRPWIPYKNYPPAKYQEVSPGKFVINPNSFEHTTIQLENDAGYVPWICIDPLQPDFNRYPSYRNASALHVRINAGDALFLPSLWYHHVRQSHCCIAVNYWYDMQYDIKYVYHKFLETLVGSQKLLKGKNES
ncbi:Bifunctional peptidase and (3S)-lysyl hydroxylase Jmjd7 [Frankliniella fusca]|uniref:Bifunctional peptidase and (3S)-lysyl hydroxylase JMJD7 n=1 Tax=Frankliniella fusca TaxID=407009 RepID=A0AAE1HL73_9NEOP|nr:Bifunctional peptidase and (3S)-lysyl hydroxylase Jmjd7 [Frankliniella fusca]